MPNTMLLLFSRKVLTQYEIVKPLYYLLERTVFLMLDAVIEQEVYNLEVLASKRAEYEEEVEKAYQLVEQYIGYIEKVTRTTFTHGIFREVLTDTELSNFTQILEDIEVCKKSIAKLDLEIYLNLEAQGRSRDLKRALTTKLNSASNAYKNWIKYE